MNKKIAWCITGGEYFLKEVLEFINTLGPSYIKLFISKAGREVIDFFDYTNLITMPYINERSFSGLELLGILSTNTISKVVIAPCTSNTIAKLLYGISDSLCTNLASQAQKKGIEVLVLPTDLEDYIIFTTKSGKKIQLKRREIDRKNIEALSKMGLFKIFYSPKELKKEILSEIT